MDAIELLRYQIKGTYTWLEMTVSDVTQEQANWRPPGVANPIGAVYAHLMITADAGFNSQLHGGMPIMATEFRGQVGLSEMPHAHGGWRDWSRLEVDWKLLREYGRAVARCVERYVDALSPAELEMRVDMTAHGQGVWKGLDIYVDGISHPRLHGGEIACLKGLQGVLGWEQGWGGDRSPSAWDTGEEGM
ncbi:MAG: DinB family protein [Chloroflexi bacterium]|nr:DinB family protein [Chloroflexota bacterium]